MVFSNNYQAQLDLIKQYCKAKFDANSESEVALFIMGSSQLRFILYPRTRDLQKIQDCLSFIHLDPCRLKFRDAVRIARIGFASSSPNKQKRVLLFAGGLTDLDDIDAVDCGKALKDLGVAVDVVNFHLEDCPGYRGLNRFGRLQLDAFVFAVNLNHNSHIVHVEPRGSISEVLSKLQATGTDDDKRVPNLVKLGNRKMAVR